MNISGKLSGLGHELYLIKESYDGSFRSRREYKPDDLDHIISDLLEIKKAWKNKLEQDE